MKIRIVIILLVINCLNSNLIAQIKDGRYVEILRLDLIGDGVNMTKIRKDSIFKYYMNLNYVDSTIGKFTIKNGYMNIKWNKKPIDIHQIKTFINPNANKSKYILFIVLDENSKPIMGGANVHYGTDLKSGLTNSLGRLAILRDDFQSKINVNGIGYQSLKFDCDTLDCKESDSIIIRLKDWNVKYIERPDKKYRIRNIDSNGFELLQGTGGYTQFLEQGYFREINIKRKVHYTKEEYDNILKY